ncbi:MAG: MFS transporter [Bacteroidales bacterium]|nr:MFS transporter [Bacteroidales bacterium]
MRSLIRKFNFVPVLATFFVMGFCDVVGIATSYLKQDFALSESLAGFIPSMVFIWFLFLSVPAAILMNRIGRKAMVQVSNAVTFVGMLIPFFSYTFVSAMVAFILLGIGNTLLQVSLNPLLTNVVKGERLTSCLTGGQVVKAVSSFCAPFLALAATAAFGNWKYLFTIYAAITLLSFLLLEVTEIPKEAESGKATSLKEAFGLLGDKTVLLFFLGIFFIVGVDVGTNTVSAKLLIERCGMDVDKASLGASVYFICRTIGAFLGTFLLARMDDIKYLKINLFLAVASMAFLFFVRPAWAILAGIGGIGFFCSSVFSVLFSQALKARPEKANEISGFMITGVCGGAVIPPLMGLATEWVGNQRGSLLVITLCLAYLVWCAFAAGRRQREASIV